MFLFSKKPKGSKGLEFSVTEVRKNEKYAHLESTEKCKDEIIIIPEEYKGAIVTQIRVDAFTSRKQVERIVLPRYANIIDGILNPNVRINHIKVDEESKFFKVEENCLVDIRDGKNRLIRALSTGGAVDTSKTDIAEIDMNAFENSDVHTIIIGKNVSVLDNHNKPVFYKDGLARVSIDADNPYFELKDNAFYKKPGGELLFALPNCTKIYVPAKELSDKEMAIYRSIPVKEIIVSEGVEIIPEDAFKDSMAEKIVLPSTLKAIRANAFSGCANINEITIPCKNGMVLGHGLFTNCKNLSKVNLEGNTQSNLFIDEAGALYYDKNIYFFPRNKGIKEYSLLPDTLEIIAGAFSTVKGLENIHLNDGLLRIGEQAFAGCDSLKKIYLPNSVVNVQNNAFLFCLSLRYIRATDSLKTMDTSLNKNTVTFCYTKSGISWRLGATYNTWTKYFGAAGFKVKFDFNAKETDAEWTSL